MCPRRVRHARALILVEVLRVARACPSVPEDKEGWVVYRYLRDPDKKRDEEQGDISEYHPVLEAELPPLCGQGLLGARA
jgi:hypothetical protein